MDNKGTTSNTFNAVERHAVTDNPCQVEHDGHVEGLTDTKELWGSNKRLAKFEYFWRWLWGALTHEVCKVREDKRRSNNLLCSPNRESEPSSLKIDTLQRSLPVHTFAHLIVHRNFDLQFFEAAINEILVPLSVQYFQAVACFDGVFVSREGEVE